MSNLPLQPLVWIEISEKVRNDPSICELDKGALWIADDNLIFRYNIKNNPNSKELPFIVNYGGRQPKEVDSVEYGKHWAEHTHYASQMQPYVKPMPTWIDARKQLPTHHQDVIVYRYNDNDGGNIEHSLYFDGEVMKGFGNVADEDGFFDDVYYWQSIETKALYEAMAMQLQIKGEWL